MEKHEIREDHTQILACTHGKTTPTQYIDMYIDTHLCAHTHIHMQPLPKEQNLTTGKTNKTIHNKK